ncbi:MAG: serine/threonine-protein kinase [Gemmataceae bacterium]
MSEGNNERQPSGQGGSESRVALEAALLDQCVRWRRGERVLAEIYLAEHPGLRADAEAALDLIGNEMLLRREKGERVELEEYLRRFPEWASQIRDQFEVERAIEGTAAGATWSPEAETGPEIDPGLPAGTAPLPTIPGYEVLGVLGRGGMGVVYRARQAGLGRLVALKMIPPGAYAGPEERARFRREAEAVARFRHPNIVQIHEVGESDGRPFFSLELVEGGTLAEKVRGTPQPARKAAELVEALARAMHLAHQQGIVHRDLKPANVLLAEDGTPKVTDFGLAKRLEGGSAHTQTGAIVGTPSYMAPEQARGQTRQVGPLVDVYALGAVLYECLTGRPPFRAATVYDTVLQAVNEEPVPPRQLNAQVPRDLETVALKCLRKEPAGRYADAEELANDLRRLPGR